MAKIPDYTQLKRAIPQVSGNIDTRGAGANISKGLMDVASVTSDIYKNKMDEEVSSADTEMYTSLIQSANSFDEDDEFDTMRQRFDGDVMSKLGEVAAKITNPDRRSNFVNKYKKDIARYGEQVSGQAWAKKVDFKKAELMTNLDNIRDSALRDKDPTALGRANELYTQTIKSARGLNYISEAEGTALLKAQRDETAKAHVAMLPVEQRLGALKQLKSQLPPDQYVALKNATEEELRIGKAQTQVDEYIAGGVDRKTVMDKIDKKYSKDPELRQDIEQRYDYAKNKQDKARTEDQSELFDTYFLPVRMGESTINDIPREDLERMSPSQQNSLMAAQSSSVAKSKAGLNRAFEDKANILYQQRKFTELRQHVIDNIGDASDSQFTKWSKISVDGVTPENELIFTIPQTIKNKTKFKGNRLNNINEAVQDWYMNQEDINKVAPTEREVSDQIDRMIMEYDTSWTWGGTKPIFEMTAEEKNSALKLAKDDDPEAFNDISQYFMDNGINPDHAQFMEAYKTIVEQRRVK